MLPKKDKRVLELKCSNHRFRERLDILVDNGRLFQVIKFYCGVLEGVMRLFYIFSLCRSVD